MPQYPTAAPGNTLTAIQTKVRRLTRSPSEAQLTTDDLNNYINTFVMYDFPEHLRTFQLRQPFTFWCNPGQSEYQTDIQSFGGALNAGFNPLYNFQNLYLNIHKPVYVGGYETYFTQDRQEFYANYPINNFIQSIGVVGDSVTTQYRGTVQFGGTQGNLPNASLVLLKNNVMFDSVDTDGNGLVMVDVPYVDDVTGIQTIYGKLFVPGRQPTTPTAPPVGRGPIQPPLLTAPYVFGALPGQIDPDNFINYSTGQFAVNFVTPPILGQAINSQTVPTIPSRPFSMLYYNNTITLRPVPDQPYAINFEVEARPTQLFNTTSVPQLEELWQLIAYGSCKKIFEDRMDTESIQAIMPEYEEQMALCLRRTLVQLANQRTSTIYAGNTDSTNQFNQGFGYVGTF